MAEDDITAWTEIWKESGGREKQNQMILERRKQ